MPRNCYIKSPLNYTGGKYRLLNRILPAFPQEYDQFVDLFAGGFNVGINVDAPVIYANDQITYLIELYEFFRSTPVEIILGLIQERIARFELSDQNAEGYLALRREYNRTGQPIDLFVLACYSFNHQIRFNQKHELNIPFGRNRSAYNPSIEANLLRFVAALQQKDIRFSTRDFLSFDFSVLQPGDLVLLPIRPNLISTAAPTVRMDAGGLRTGTPVEDRQLLGLLDDLDRAGIRFALSNVLTHKGLRNEELIRWSQRYHVLHLEQSYANCSYHAKDRSGNTEEVLITNYAPPLPQEE